MVEVLKIPDLGNQFIVGEVPPVWKLKRTDLNSLPTFTLEEALKPLVVVARRATFLSPLDKNIVFIEYLISALGLSKEKAAEYLKVKPEQLDRFLSIPDAVEEEDRRKLVTRFNRLIGPVPGLPSEARKPPTRGPITVAQQIELRRRQRQQDRAKREREIIDGILGFVEEVKNGNRKFTAGGLVRSVRANNYRVMEIYDQLALQGQVPARTELVANVTTPRF